MNRRTFFPTAAALADIFAQDLLARAPASQRKTKHVVLFTSDGVRWQDLFTGIDPNLMNAKAAGMADAATLRKQLWRPTPEERREALMPFFWKTLVPKGVLFGNLNKGSSVQVTNRYRVSYPGYSEIMTGRAQDEAIRGNDAVQNPAPSFMQFLKDQWKLPKEKVAVFGSWDMFHYICESRRGEIYINAGYEESALPEA